jgi:dihydrofolate reductase
MPFSLIAAVARNRVIGDRGKLPWHLPGDMARFRRLTLGHAVLMGRATFASLGKPLPGRRNIVLSRDTALQLPGCEVVHSVQEAAEAAGDAESFIIGGATLYQEFLPISLRMYLTMIEADVPGDTLFPRVDWNQWRIIAETPGGAGTAALPYNFIDYERLRP